jgi:hypothetical protein
MDKYRDIARSIKVAQKKIPINEIPVSCSTSRISKTTLEELDTPAQHNEPTNESGDETVPTPASDASSSY